MPFKVKFELSPVYRKPAEIDQWCESHDPFEKPVFISDSQDLADFRQYFTGNRKILDGITGALIVTGEADYRHVWVTFSSQPHSVYAFFRKIRMRVYEDKRKPTQWRLSSDFSLNSATIAEAGIEATRDDLFLNRPIFGSLKQLMKVASDLRWHWINGNGYNAITVSREAGKVTYTVRAHFGSPAYTLCVIERI